MNTVIAKINEVLPSGKLDSIEQAMELATSTVVIIKKRPAVEEEVVTSEFAPPLKRGKRGPWVCLLAERVAKPLHVTVATAGGALSVTGAESDVESFKHLAGLLVTEADRLSWLHERAARTEAKKAGDPTPAAPRRAFLLDFVTRVGDVLS